MALAYSDVPVHDPRPEHHIAAAEICQHPAGSGVVYGSNDVYDLAIEVAEFSGLNEGAVLTLEAFNDGRLSAEQAIGYLLLYDAAEQNDELKKEIFGVIEW